MEPRDFGALSAAYICQILPERNSDGTVVECAPHGLYQNRKGLVLHKDGPGPFCKFRGVYIVTRNGNACYVGECVHLSKRFNMGYGQISPRNCFVGGQSTNCRLNRRVLEAASRGETVELWFVATENRESVEFSLISTLRPEWNVQNKF